MTSKKQVNEFLDNIRSIILKDGGRHYYPPGDRQKNREDLADLELTPYEAKEIILHLEAEDYYKGPKINHSLDNTISYEFGYIVDRDEIYIKLELIEDEINKCQCISFHKADFPIVYPLKGDD